MPFLFGMMMIYYTMSSIEAHFADKQADLATMLVFNAVVSLFYAFVANDYMVM